MSSTAKNPSAGRTASCPYTSAPPGMSPRKSRTGSPISFKSTPHLITAQTRASRGFQRFRPPFIRTLVRYIRYFTGVLDGREHLAFLEEARSGDLCPLEIEPDGCRTAPL